MSEITSESAPKNHEQQSVRDQQSETPRQAEHDDDASRFSAIRGALSEKATALAVVAALALPGVAYAGESDPDHDGRLGTTTTTITNTPIESTILAAYKRKYEEGPTPLGELETDAAVKANLFAREIAREVADGGEVLTITVSAQSSAEAHSQALKHGDNPDTSDARVQDTDPKNIALAEQRKGRGMNLVETVVESYLKKNGVTVSSIVPGNASEDMWSDDQVKQVDAIADRNGYDSIYWITEAVNRGQAKLSAEDQAALDHVLKDERWVKLVANIRSESQNTEHHDNPIIKKTDFAVPAYWLAPLSPDKEKSYPDKQLTPQYRPAVAFHDNRPREYNFNKNANARLLSGKPRGRLERSTEGNQGGKTKGRRSHV